MSSSNNHKVISHANMHTQKKFELIENYIMPWAQKLMNNPACRGLVFIDCMCNSGLYHDDNNNVIEGTPLRVAKVLREVAGQYWTKQVYLYFNDLDSAKTAVLKENLPKETRNFHIVVTNKDANELLKSIGQRLDQPNLHYFLLYDPYDANIDWAALLPFFRYWGEVMINHMVSDSIRAISQVKKETTKEKYEGTYLADFEDLVPFGSNKEAFEDRIKHIIDVCKGNRRYYVAAYPFYNTRNSQVYSLIHCTSNPVGFELYKKTAWQTFGDKSSTKNTHGSENQMMFSFDETPMISTVTDETCFYVKDIAKYLQECFVEKQNVPLTALWKQLELHPIFPSEGYRDQIKTELKNTYGAIIHKGRNAITGKQETLITFRRGTTLL